MTRKLGIAALTICCIAGTRYFTGVGYAGSDGPTTGPNTEKHSRVIVHRKDSSGQRDGHERERHRERRHYSPEAFRQFIKAELEHLPALDSRMDRLMKIQAERHELQKQRQAVAAHPERDRSATIEKFHSLLRRDLNLSDESRKIAQEIVKDLPVIQQQIETRKSHLESSLSKVNTSAADDDSTSAEARDLRRKIRYVEFLDKKLRDLENHPERIDVLTRILRGVPFDDNDRDDEDYGDPRTPEAHLHKLRIKKRTLQRELNQVENEINLLKEKGVKESDKPLPKAKPE